MTILCKRKRTRCNAQTCIRSPTFSATDDYDADDAQANKFSEFGNIEFLVATNTAWTGYSIFIVHYIIISVVVVVVPELCTKDSIRLCLPLPLLPAGAVGVTTWPGSGERGL